MAGVFPQPSKLHGVGLVAVNYTFAAGEKIVSEGPMLSLPTFTSSTVAASVDQFFSDVRKLKKHELAFLRHLLVRGKSAMKSMPASDLASALSQPNPQTAEALIDLSWSHNDMDVAPRQLTRAIVEDGRAAEAAGAATAFLSLYEDAISTTEGDWACERVAEVHQVLYVVSAAMAAVVADYPGQRRECSRLDGMAFNHEVLQLKFLGPAFGLRHRKSACVMEQLFDLAEGSFFKTKQLRDCLKELGAKLKRIDVGGRKSLIAEIQDDDDEL